MAVSDLAFPLTTIPLDLSELATSSKQWPIGGTTGLILCKLKTFLQSLSITVSAQSLVWIAVDRFVAVVLPMKVHLISSRFRSFAIASTWIVAMAGNSLFLYFFQLVELKNGDISCTPFYNNPSSYLTFIRVYTALFQITPFVALPILYCVIAVTLRRQDKALQCRAVHQKNQRKRRAIKMSFCIVAAFYICGLPMLLLFLLLEYDIAVPCLFSKVLTLVAYPALFLSSAINPIICMTSVQSYRRGLKDIFNWCCTKWLTTNNNTRTGEQEEITLQGIRRIPWMEENLTLNE
ncbi:Galanin receptor type 1 [Desmophyllum pertusum]|uniref:Galanin receptor type 1 n=1 Tax=Desmophyllum pertusum TaxID=174260 RepID=A0A9W9Y8C8_9CNID|nr:Galanin receptor type 1 [Desmophyllum pertusum]